MLWHVVTASKAYLLLEMNKIEDADRVKSIGVDLTAFKTCIRTNCVCVTAIATKILDKLKKHYPHKLLGPKFLSSSLIGKVANGFTFE